MEKKNGVSAPTKQTANLPVLSPELRTVLNGKALRNAPESSREGIALVMRAMQSPSEQLRNLPDGDRIKTALVTMGSAYCGINPKETALTTWRECSDFLKKEYPAIIPDEILEAFRFAASPRCFKQVNFAAYSGRFTLNILKEVMAAYGEERRAIQAAIERGIQQIQAEQQNTAEKLRNDAARRQFVFDFRALKERGEVLALDKIRFFWFEALKESGELDDITADEKRDLWAEARELVIAEKQEEGSADRLAGVGIRRMLSDIAAGAGMPDEWKMKRVTIYQKLLIRQALLNAAMDGINRVDPADMPKPEIEELPF